MITFDWMGFSGSVDCSADELAEAMKLPNEIMFGCWLGEVEELGHDSAIRWAWEYDEMLRGEPNPENPFA